MNFLFSSYSMMESAYAVDDKRLGTFIKETCQMVSTDIMFRLNATGFHCGSAEDLGLYKPTHVNHPVAVWVRSRYRHRKMILSWADHLADAYELAFGHREHKSIEVLGRLHEYHYLKDDLPSADPPNCAANEGLCLDFRHITPTILAYRLYMIERWKTDVRRVTWRGRGGPVWLNYPEFGLTTY